MRYEVRKDKAIRFFEEHMFKRVRVQYFARNKHYGNEALYLEMPKDAPVLNESIVGKGASKQKVTLLDLQKVLEPLEEDAQGRKALEVPCGKSTMEQALKAVAKLDELQKLRVHNPSQGDFTSDPIRDLIDQYDQRLIRGGSVSARDPTMNSIVGTTYDARQHVQLLLDSWEMYGEVDMLTALKTHVSFSVRHAMLLRDEDLRNSMLSNYCFRLPFSSLSSGRTLETGLTSGALIG
ncbi:hypothetical protein DFQ26_001713 [Actinomortierella ambigua]|nr:hypothetical protein DFQ26_001713 [Actinomortierella ambigua]